VESRQPTGDGPDPPARNDRDRPVGQTPNRSRPPAKLIGVCGALGALMAKRGPASGGGGNPTETFNQIVALPSRSASCRSALKEGSRDQGLHVVKASTVLATRTRCSRANMSELPVLRRDAEAPEGAAEGAGRTGRAVADRGVGHPGVPQILLTECISARDLSTILEGMADSLSFNRSPPTLAKHVRGAGGRSCSIHSQPPSRHRRAHPGRRCPAPPARPHVSATK
jgi:hypothetical protein